MTPVLGLQKLTCPFANLQRHQSSRTLSRYASTSTSQTQIAPESPRFIDIPRPPQQEAPRKPIIKGVLPVPRQIFTRRGGDKASPEYLAAVTPEPTKKRGPTTSDPWATGFVDWKTRQAARRRKNLREGLVELQYRKQQTDRQNAARSAYRLAENERRLYRPEREDERLTSATVPQALVAGRSRGLADPNREARVAEKKAKVEAHEAERREERRNALHSLYMNARSFIVTQDVLYQEVDKVFDDDFISETHQPGRNVWDEKGIPTTVTELLRRANEGSSRAVDSHSGSANITRERVRKIAEELTGGKMESPEPRTSS
ncbi:hypothetical protein MMC20_006592 [Loxospora ochrophaea]|nr:hypothetical protein [Loxospora ochrophaea]